jgi:hypothetical protein
MRSAATGTRLVLEHFVHDTSHQALKIIDSEDIAAQRNVSPAYRETFLQSTRHTWWVFIKPTPLHM